MYRSSRIMSFMDFCIFCLILLIEKSYGINPNYTACVPKRCGNGQIIKFPFYIGNLQESICGLFRISCSSNSSGGFPIYRLSENDYVIQEIFYENQSFRVYNSAVDNLAQNCFSQLRNVSVPSPSMGVLSRTRLHLLSRCNNGSMSEQLRRYQVGCNNDTGAMLGSDENLGSAVRECEINVVAPVELTGNDEGRIIRNGGVVEEDYEEMLRRGFALNWMSRNCTSCEQSGGRCGVNPSTNGFRCFCTYGFEYTVCRSRRPELNIILAIAAPTGGIVLLVILTFYLKRKFPFSESENKDLETFIKNCGSLAPKRYHYSDVKKMTNSFNTKLGQGGYGSVYKGKLRDGSLVAVKVLKESKGNGEEFINEVASFSRTSHVNIVSLLGLCAEGKKKALVYEFMPNGSLEKFIYGDRSSINRQLEWQMLYKIAVGIARGLEYLHRGCNTRILHFDIKPHNILLDENFCPKISDFGLAKLCTRKESMISTMAARGTIGYIAPEIVYNNIGGISHKSDVYSYGMMVLEMVGGRKNVDGGVDHTSEIYFPLWVYSRLCEGEELDISGIKDDEEKEQARKMIIVSLWCIQTNPSNRPTISEVIEMLEGPLKGLEMPPRPFLYSPSRASFQGSTMSCHLVTLFDS